MPVKLVPAGSKRGSGHPEIPEKLDSRLRGNDKKRPHYEKTVFFDRFYLIKY
jgi:hypothetical protein